MFLSAVGEEYFKKIKAHETMIRQLQFDATRIVSCGNDGTAVIIDITNGEVSQSLRGHEKKSYQYVLILLNFDCIFR